MKQPAQIYHFEKMEDLLILTPEQFERFIPDLKEWIEFRNKFKRIAENLPPEFIGPSDGMKWIDDGEVGLRHITFSMPKQSNE